MVMFSILHTGEATDDNARRNENLRSSAVLAFLEKCCIHFNFRPHLVRESILEAIVPKVGSSQEARVRSWQGSSERSLKIRVADAFSISNRRRNNRMERPISMSASRQAHSKKGRQGIAPALLIRRAQTVL